MTIDEHIEAEKRVASGFLVACQTTREADEFGVYGKEAQMYEDKYYVHTERAELLEELKRRRELSERNRPISEMLVDVQAENAILTKALELSCIDRSNYKELVDAYLEKAREDNE